MKFESVSLWRSFPSTVSQVAISQKRIPIYLAMGIQAQLAANAGRFATKRAQFRLKTAKFPLSSHLKREWSTPSTDLQIHAAFPFIFPCTSLLTNDPLPAL
jgi:hypothetical protein